MAVELAAEAVVDPGDVAEAEAGEDLVVVAPGARSLAFCPQLEHILNHLSRNRCLSIKECSLTQVVLYFL